MPGPAPNPNHARRNRAPTAAKPPAWAVALRKGRPALPNRGRGGAWHPKTRDWWAHIWESPHAWRYSDVELDGLLQLAEMVDTFNYLPRDDDRRLKWAAEIRMQRRDYGLTPSDRFRLQWTEEEQPLAAVRPAPSTAPDDDIDPRAVLRAVK